jgi:hypothetical protein
LEVAEQVADEIAATVARIAAVAIFPGAVEMVEARQFWYGAGVLRRSRQFDVNRLMRFDRLLGRPSAYPGGVKRIDG